MKPKKILLAILDGWGHGPKPSSSAIAQAKTPFVSSLYHQYPHAELVTFGEDVGLPEGQMGNSEVGHLNIGAGRVVYQELARINKACREGSILQNPTLVEALNYAKTNKKAVHFVGLVSNGGVHSHINHLKTLCDMTQTHGLARVYIHAFTDGRDCDPKSGKAFLGELENRIQKTKVKIASVIGRYYAMDRDKRWERVKLAYDVMVNGIGTPITSLPSDIENSYKEGITDEFVKPLIAVGKTGKAIGKIKKGDVVICFNFRTDRLRELTEVLSQKDFPDFGMKKLPLYYVTITRYDENFKDVHVVFQKDDLSQTLGEVLAHHGKTQVRIAETEKYPHVTFFFSGGREAVFPNERRLMAASPKVATYDLQPEMSAVELTSLIVADIEQNQPDFICLNYANTDMVGHTGVFSAVVKAAETVDACLEKLITTALKYDYEAIVIADHGNADYMINEDGTPNTAHTTNPVPCFYIGKNTQGVTLKNGKLADVAPTILQLMGVPKPQEMDGTSLL
jgi:2,3-bisphosphoglycerate-independent phosphoglycerate mutase